MAVTLSSAACQTGKTGDSVEVHPMLLRPQQLWELTFPLPYPLAPQNCNLYPNIFVMPPEPTLVHSYQQSQTSLLILKNTCVYSTLCMPPLSAACLQAFLATTINWVGISHATIIQFFQSRYNFLWHTGLHGHQSIEALLNFKWTEGQHCLSQCIYFLYSLDFKILCIFLALVQSAKDSCFLRIHDKKMNQLLILSAPKCQVIRCLW